MNAPAEIDVERVDRDVEQRVGRERHERQQHGGGER